MKTTPRSATEGNPRENGRNQNDGPESSGGLSVGKMRLSCCRYTVIFSDFYEKFNCLQKCETFVVFFTKDQYHVREVPTLKLAADEEFLPFQENSFDLVVSSLR